MIFDPKNDDMFKDAAYSMSLMTALVEACEWDVLKLLDNEVNKRARKELESI